jgi:hypothetical protein
VPVVDDKPATGLDDARQLYDEPTIVRNGFQEVYDNDLIKSGVWKGVLLPSSW